MTTNTEFVLDSYAWIEYFNGSPKGRSVKELIKAKKAVTPTIVIGELSTRYGSFKEWESMLDLIQNAARIVDLTLSIANQAGIFKTQMRKKFKNNFGLADAIILATARENNAKVVTGDRHFKGLPETIFLE